MPQSTLDATGKCMPASSPPDNYFAVSDGIDMMAMEIPTDRWAIPIHADFMQ